MYRALILAALLVASATSLAAQEREVETRVVVRGDPITAVFVDEEGKSEIVPLGDASGLAWVAAPGKDGHRLRYLDLGAHRRYIGLRLMRLTPELKEHFGVAGEGGAMVSRVHEDTPAERAGIRVGDIITAAAGETIQTTGDLARVIAGLEEDAEVGLELVRDGDTMSLGVVPEERPRTVMNLTPELLERRALLLDRDFDFQELQAPDFEELRKSARKLHDAHVLRLDRYEDVEEALRRLDEYFESDEWKERLDHLESTDWQSVEERMRAVERRLRELEGELADGK